MNKRNKERLLCLFVALVLPWSLGSFAKQIREITEKTVITVNQNGFSQSATVPAQPLLDQFTIALYNKWPAEVSNTQRFSAGAIDSNGVIWLIPNTGNGFVSLNTSNGDFSYHPILSTYPGLSELEDTYLDKFSSCVYDGQRYLWVIPGSVNCVIRLDTTDGSMVGYSSWPQSGLGLKVNKFYGSVLYDNYLWLLPYNHDSIIKLDTASGAMSVAAQLPAELELTTREFKGGVLDDEGNIWLVPQANDKLLKFNCATTTFSTYALPSELEVLGNMMRRFAGAIYDMQGYLWLVPEAARQVLRVKTSDGSMTLFAIPATAAISGDNDMWSFLDAVFDGRFMWLVPIHGTNLVRLDTKDGTLLVYHDWFMKTGGTLARNFCSGAFDGKDVWIFPSNKNSVVKLSSQVTSDLKLTVAPALEKVYQPNIVTINAIAENQQTIAEETVGAIVAYQYFRVALSDAGDYSSLADFTAQFVASADTDKKQQENNSEKAANYTFEIPADKNGKYWVRVKFQDYAGDFHYQTKMVSIENIYQPLKLYKSGKQQESGEFFYQDDLVLTTAGSPSYGIAYDLDGSSVLTQPPLGFDTVALTATAGAWQPHWLLDASGNPEIAELVLDGAYLSSTLGTNYVFTYVKNYDYYKYSIVFDSNGGNDDGQEVMQHLLAGSYELSEFKQPTHKQVNNHDVKFIGWSLQAYPILSQGQELPPMIKQVNIETSDARVYAVWGLDTNANGRADVLEERYRIFYDLNGGKNSQQEKWNNLLSGLYTLENDNLPNHDKHEGQDVLFIGWSLQQCKILAHDAKLPQLIKQINLLDYDLTVYAVWAYDSNANNKADILEDKYQLTVTGSYAPVSGSGHYLPNSEVTISSGYREGFRFLFFSFEPEQPALESTKESLTFMMPEHDLLIQTNWEKNSDRNIDAPPNTGDKLFDNIYLIMMLVVILPLIAFMLYGGRDLRKIKHRAVE